MALLRRFARSLGSCYRRPFLADTYGIRRLSGAKGGGGSRDDDDEGDDLMDMDDMFGLHEESKAEMQRKKEEQERIEREELLKNKDYVQGMEKKRKQAELRHAQISTKVGDKIVEELMQAHDKYKDSKNLYVDVGLPLKFAKMTPHMLQTMRFLEVKYSKIFSYDAHLAGHKRHLLVNIFYNLRNSDHPTLLKFAIQGICERNYIWKSGIIRFKTKLFDTVEENTIFLVYMMDQVLQEAKRSVGIEIPEEDLRDISDEWETIKDKATQQFNREGYGKWLQLEYERAQAEVAKRDTITQEYLIHRDYWYKGESVKEARQKAKKWKEENVKKHEKVLRRIPKEFVEKKSLRFAPKDLLLY